MKIRLSTILSCMLVLCGAASCYADLSTEMSREEDELLSEAYGEPISIAYGSTLRFAPNVIRKDGSTDGLTYLWSINPIANNRSNFYEIGDGPEIEYEVINSPSDKPYELTLYVEDPQTLLTRTFIWPLYVTNPFGEGLLIAHTKDGGATSDLDLVASKAITYGYESNFPTYTRGIWSLAQGEPIEGRVYGLMPFSHSVTSVHDAKTLMLSLENDMIGLDPTTYKPNLKNIQFFTMAPEGGYKARHTVLCSGHYVITLIEGTIYTLGTDMGGMFTQFNYYGSGKNSFTPECIAAENNDSYSDFYVYDPIERTFSGILGWQIFTGSPSTIQADPLPEGTTAVFAGNLNGSGSFLMKHPDGSYKLYMLSYDMEPAITNIYDIPGDKDLDKAICFAFCDNAPIIYYATENKIYSITVTPASSTVRALSWKPDNAAEKITGISQYHQYWYGREKLFTSNDYGFILPLNRAQMLITTYNEKTGEGKIYLRPFNLSTGLFTMTDNGSLGGFGEITAITPMGR